MANIRDILLTVGKVSASIVLNTFLPGSGGIVQTVENLLGPSTGAEKKKLALTLTTTILDTLAKSGKLDAAAPTAAEIEKAIQTTVDTMKKAGTLEETGVMKVGGLAYQVIVMGKLPE